MWKRSITIYPSVNILKVFSALATEFCLQTMLKTQQLFHFFLPSGRRL